ncbi:aromatic acid exporter family protein [Streptomyces argenteolus]|uniref:Aromatic acid exporter family protein n=1 Tax=Streptomyces argenteolus TaxID=67274 RepID=A0ABW6X4L5_9ACTN
MQATRAARRQSRYEFAAVGRSARLALRYSGPERATAVQALKAAGAAMLAWALAAFWIESPMALMAPWTALVLVDSTVYRSLRAGVRQLGVISVGAIWASLAMYVTNGSTLPAMAISLPWLMLIAGYRRLGAHGIYGATTALFVIAYGAYQPWQVGHRLLETLIGAVIGLSVNAFVLPPVRIDGVRANLHALAVECGNLLQAMGDGLEHSWGAARAEVWEDQARRLHRGVQAVARARNRAAESSRLNPGRRMRRGDRTARIPPQTDRKWEAVVHHITALSHTLADVAARSHALSSPTDTFRCDYAALTRAVARLCAEQAEMLAQHHTDGAARQEQVGAVWRRYEQVLGEVPNQKEVSATAVSGGLLIQIRQLLRTLTPGPEAA